MNKHISKNGYIAAGLLVAANLISFLILGTNPDNYEIGEIIGYATIVGSLILVVVGMRSYQMQADSKPSFLKSMLVGCGISLFPSFAFGLYNVVYVTWIDPDFIQNYTEYSLEQMKASMTAEAFEAARAQTLEEMAMFDNLFLQFIIMFMTVFMIGLIISLVSATYFQLKPAK